MFLFIIICGLLDVDSLGLLSSSDDVMSARGCFKKS